MCERNQAVVQIWNSAISYFRWLVVPAMRADVLDEPMSSIIDEDPVFKKKKKPNVLDFTLGLCEDLKSLSFKYYFMHFLYCFQSCLYRLLNILINILNISKYIRNEHNYCLKITKCYLNKIQIFDIQM